MTSARHILRNSALFASGAFLAWLITADHYGHIVRADPVAGIICRVHGLTTVRMGHWREATYVCADLTRAEPEQAHFDRMMDSIREHWGLPR